MKVRPCLRKQMRYLLEQWAATPGPHSRDSDAPPACSFSRATHHVQSSSTAEQRCSTLTVVVVHRCDRGRVRHLPLVPQEGHLAAAACTADSCGHTQESGAGQQGAAEHQEGA